MKSASEFMSSLETTGIMTNYNISNKSSPLQMDTLSPNASKIYPCWSDTVGASSPQLRSHSGYQLSFGLSAVELQTSRPPWSLERGPLEALALPWSSLLCPWRMRLLFSLVACFSPFSAPKPNVAIWISALLFPRDRIISSNHVISLCANFLMLKQHYLKVQYYLSEDTLLIRQFVWASSSNWFWQ